jgi:RNA polymerase sigma factor (TIGR02999 family)
MSSLVCARSFLGITPLELIHLQPSFEPVSQLLARWEAGDREALHSLVPLIYRELRRQAHRYMRQERPGHTLQTTALVHEAFMRLHHLAPAHCENRAHFFAISAQLMRQILVDHARRRKAAKRDGGARLTLEDVTSLIASRSVDLLELDDALKSLGQLDAQQSLIVELRFFAGLSIEETSQVLGVSPATVKRDWATARVWLHRNMFREQRHDA